MSEKIPTNEERAKEYFDEKYGDRDDDISKSNRKANQKASKKFMPMDGKFTREYERIRIEKDQKKFGK